MSDADAEVASLHARAPPPLTAADAVRYAVIIAVAVTLGVTMFRIRYSMALNAARDRDTRDLGDGRYFARCTRIALARLMRVRHCSWSRTRPCTNYIIYRNRSV